MFCCGYRILILLKVIDTIHDFPMKLTTHYFIGSSLLLFLYTEKHNYFLYNIIHYYLISDMFFCNHNTVIFLKVIDSTYVQSLHKLHIKKKKQ